MEKFKNLILRSLPYLLAATLSTVILLCTLNYFKRDINIPLNYSGDAIVHYNFAKNIQDTGWWTTNPSYGAPGIQELTDFPLTENIQVLLLKIIIMLGFNWYMSLNIFFVVTFGLTVITTMFVMKKLGINTVTAMALSIIYSFLPYHFLRGIDHVFLASYFVIPICFLVIYYVAANKYPDYPYLVLYALVIASSGAYYTYLTLILLFVAGIYAFINKFNIKNIVNFSFLTGCIFIFLLLNLSPTLVNNQHFGKNLTSSVRSPADTERFGLKLIQLLLPIEDHNINLFNKIQKYYLRNGFIETINENSFAVLGIVGASGFMILLAWLLFFSKKFDSELGKKLNILSVLNIAAVLFATTAGFSMIISTYLDPTFRSVNRMSIYIALFCLIAVGLLIELIKNTKLKVILSVLLMLFALYDQISLGTLRNFTNNRENFDKLKTFASQISEDVGKDGKIFTLPFGQYPEGNDKNIMKVALLTDDIKWSAGAQKWREENYWQYQVIIKPTTEFIEAISKEGFDALLVYTPDFNAQKLYEIEEILQTTPITTNDNEYRYYSLKNYKSKNKLSISYESVFIHVSGNCLNDYIYSIDLHVNYWCKDKAYIILTNKTKNPIQKKLKVEMSNSKKGFFTIEENIEVPSGKSKYSLEQYIDQNEFFTIPKYFNYWPGSLGFPNLIVKKAELLSH